MKTKLLLSLIACGFMMSGVDVFGYQSISAQQYREGFDYSRGHTEFVKYICDIDPNIGVIIDDVDYNILDIPREFTNVAPPHTVGHHCINLLPQRLNNLYELIDNINNIGLPASTQQRLVKLLQGAIAYTKMILRRYGYDL